MELTAEALVFTRREMEIGRPRCEDAAGIASPVHRQGFRV